MANPTSIKNGEIVTTTASETEYEITAPYTTPLQDVKLLWVSGTVQYGVYEKTATFTTQMTATNGSLSASGDKDILTIQNGYFNLRLKGAGSVKVSW
jgi:hypothetical protein